MDKRKLFTVNICVTQTRENAPDQFALLVSDVDERRCGGGWAGRRRRCIVNSRDNHGQVWQAGLWAAVAAFARQVNAEVVHLASKWGEI